MKKIVLLRHGQSTWNQENRFTGWKDVPLSEKGELEAQAAGKVLRENGYSFDLAYTSLLRRAIDTLWYTLKELDQMWLPVTKDWRLNERHYGALQGLNKKETADKHGAEQVHIWRRSYDTPPPAFEKGNKENPAYDPRYKDLGDRAPYSESLKDTVDRVLPYWNSEIWPQVKEGKKIIIAAHGNSIRALVKHLDSMSDDEISDVNIPTGTPLVYELNDEGKAENKYYLGDQDRIKSEMESVKNQSK